MNINNRNDIEGNIAEQYSDCDILIAHMGDIKLRELESIANDRDDMVLVKAEVDANGNKEVAMEYGVIGIPAVFLIKNGEVVEKFSGVQTRAKIEELIEKSK